MTATLRPLSHSTRPPTELRGAPFPAAAGPARSRHEAASQPSLLDALGGFAELELPTATLLAIPELGSFDQEELNDNPVLNEVCPIPLIGGLLLARQLITREQLDTCLLLQSQIYPDMPIGQILVRSGYVSQAALDRALGIQADMRSALEDAPQAAAAPGATAPQARRQR